MFLVLNGSPGVCVVCVWIVFALLCYLFFFEIHTPEHARLCVE